MGLFGRRKQPVESEATQPAPTTSQNGEAKPEAPKSSGYKFAPSKTTSSRILSKKDMKGFD